MAIDITFLGTGGAFSDFRENYHNNAIVKTDRGWVLLDCGATAVQSLKELGISVHDVVGVIVTHCHGDHIGGLEQLMWERFYTGPDGPVWSGTPVWGSPRILDDVRKSLWACMDEFTDATGVHNNGYNRLAANCPFSLDGTLVVGDTGFNFHRTPHVKGGKVDKPCYGVEIRKEGVGCYFTSDTTFRPGIGDLFPTGAIFHDCTFSPYYKGTVHTHYEELCTLPPEVRARIVLMHHSKVPEGVDPLKDGFFLAADRHDSFHIGEEIQVIPAGTDRL